MSRFWISRARARRGPALDGVDLHQQDVVGGGFVEQREQRRVADIAAVPIGLAVDLHRRKDGGQAGRRQHVIGRQLGAFEDPGLAGPDIGGGDEQLHLPAGAHALEVDQLAQRVAERVDVERVPLGGAERAGPRVEPRPRRRAVRVPIAEQQAEELLLRRRERAVEADALPERAQLLARALRAALQPALGQDDGVDRPGARAGDRLDGEPPVLQQRVEHAPREGSVRAAALQSERYRLLRPRPGQAVQRTVRSSGLASVFAQYRSIFCRQSLNAS